MRFPKLDLLIRDPAAHFSGGSIDHFTLPVSLTSNCLVSSVRLALVGFVLLTVRPSAAASGRHRERDRQPSEVTANENLLL